MKKTFLVLILTVFILSFFGCNSVDSTQITRKMIKTLNEYTIALKKVSTKEDLVKAMKTYIKVIKPVIEEMKNAIKEDPKSVGENAGNKKLQKELGDAFKNMGDSQMADNVAKFLTEPEIKLLLKDIKKIMSMK